MIGDAIADTIFALSSGTPPAAIAIIRISGPQAGSALGQLIGRLPVPRFASLRQLRCPNDGSLLDRALVLWIPGPATATGEDVAELHCHGGRAVVAAVLGVLAGMHGLRPAEPGEFTRRAFDNGVIDLAQAEGLADLLAAETETERRSAVGNADGGLSRLLAHWRTRLIEIAAIIEAGIEYEDADDTVLAMDTRSLIMTVADELRAAVAMPPPTRIGDGIRVVIAGSPNTGKSTLLNAIAGRPAALVSDVPGTTRDVIEVPVSIEGLPFLFCDTAGLRSTDDAIEVLGIAAARQRIDAADILLWLDKSEPPLHSHCLKIASKADLLPWRPDADLAISAVTGVGLDQLRRHLVAAAGLLLSRSNPMLNLWQHSTVTAALMSLEEAVEAQDPLLTAQSIWDAICTLDRLSGQHTVDEVLTSLFNRFCVGK